MHQTWKVSMYLYQMLKICTFVHLASCTGHKSPWAVKRMIHGSTSFNFSWSTNIEYYCDLLNHCCTCWILIQLSLINNYTCWRKVKIADKEMLLCCFVLQALLRQQPQNNHKISTQEWLRDRTIFGAYYTLLAILRNLDISTLRPPCWYFHITRWHQTWKRLVEAVQQAATCWTE